MGVTLRVAWTSDHRFGLGLKFSQKTLLQAAIVFAGAGLTIDQIWSSGSAALPLIIVTILVGLFLIPYAGRALGRFHRLDVWPLERYGHSRHLIGACGGVWELEEEDFDCIEPVVVELEYDVKP